MRYAKEFIVSITGAIVRVAVLIIFIFFIMSCAKSAYEFGYRIFTEQPMSPSPGRDITVTVEDGQGDMDIAKMIEEKGLCRDYKLFVIQRKLSVHKDPIKPGSYTLNTSMSMDDMFAVLAGENLKKDDIMMLSEDEYAEELNPETDDLTGLETGGVLADDDETYSEGEAFEDDEEEEEIPEGDEGEEDEGEVGGE